MKFDELDSRMRLGESFHNLRVPPGLFIVVRADGRSFSRLTARLTEKPFDAGFHGWMIEAAKGLLTTLHGLYAYTESDEISVLLPRSSDIFDREVEKLVSISAARAAAVVSVACGQPVEFDARLWLGGRDEDVVDYFSWRQSDATRCALNGWCYWTLRKEGKSAREASRELETASLSKKNELLRARNIHFAQVPGWQQRGTGLYWEAYEKEGFNPKTGRPASARRRRIAECSELPAKAAYAEMLRGITTSQS